MPPLRRRRGGARVIWHVRYQVRPRVQPLLVVETGNGRCGHFSGLPLPRDVDVFARDCARSGELRRKHDLTNLNLTRSGIHHRTVLRGAYFLFNMWNLGFRRFHPLVVTRDRDGVALPRLGRLFAPGGDALLEEAVVGAARVPRLGQKGQIPPRSEN